MAEPKRKRNGWLWFQLVIVGLLTLKLVVAGFDFGRGWTDRLFQPEEAAAQQEDKDSGQAKEAKDDSGQEAANKNGEKAPESDAKALGPQQMEVLRSIENRKKKLEDREKEMDRRSKELADLEKLVDQKMATLEKLRQEFEQQVKAEEARQNKRIKHLVALYSNMKAKAAAEVMEEMDIDLAVEIFRQMRGREAGKILAFVTPEKASKISRMLSEKVED